MRAALAEINLSALVKNLHQVRATAPGTKVLAIVKADGYGHGLEAVASALAHAPHPADAFGVASIDDALRLRQHGIRERIVLLSGFDELADFPYIAQLDLDCVIHHPSQIALLKQARPSRAMRIWLKVDTGMRRLGFYPAQLAEVIDDLKQLLPPGSEWVVMSHFAQSDEIGARRSLSEQHAAEQSARQIRAFDALSLTANYAQSLANSGAILGAPEAHRQWVRPGGVLYGLSTHSDACGHELGFTPVMRLSTRLIATKNVEAGDAVGYGGGFIATKRMRIGIAAIGYGDGYPRHASGGAPVRVAGQLSKTVGRVAMDLLSVDLTGIEQAEVGAEVVLWGPELPVETVARAASTISYELTCGITRRVRFRYTGETALGRPD